jgi:hypothetical protein
MTHGIPGGLWRAAWVAVCVLAGASSGAAQGKPPGPAALLEQARAAYERRGEPGATARAVDLYERAIKAGAGCDALWEAARAASDLGESGLPASAKDSDRISYFEKGMAWARAAIAIEPTRPEGHLFYVVNLGDKVDRAGLWQQMRFAGELHREAELAVKYGPEIECGLPMTVLGLYLIRAPGVFGGDHERGLALLERALTVCPGDVQNHLDLAEGLERAGQRARAIVELEWVLAHKPMAPSARADYARQRSEAETHLVQLKQHK